MKSNFLVVIIVVLLLIQSTLHKTHGFSEENTKEEDIDTAVSRIMYEYVKELNLKAPCGLKKPIYIFEDDAEIADVFKEYCGYELGREIFVVKKIDFNKKGTYVFDLRRNVLMGKPLLIKRGYFSKIRAGEYFYAGVSRPYPYPREKIYNKTEMGINKSFSKIYYDLWSRKTVDKPFWKVYYVVKKPRKIESLDFLNEGIVIFLFEKNSIINFNSGIVVINPFKPNPKYFEFSSINTEGKECKSCMPLFIEYSDEKIKEGWIYGINCIETCYGYKIVVYEYNKKEMNNKVKNKVKNYNLSNKASDIDRKKISGQNVTEKITGKAYTAVPKLKTEILAVVLFSALIVALILVLLSKKLK